jgi:hypothetical protein
MGCATSVTVQLQLRELGDCDLQSVAYPPEPSFLGFFLRSGDLFEEVAAKGIIAPTYRSIRFSNQLGNNVQVAYRCKEVCHLSKGSVYVDLLQISLGKPLWVFFILLIRSLEDHLSFLRYTLLLQNWALLVVLAEAYLVFPGGCALIHTYAYTDDNIRISTRR